MLAARNLRPVRLNLRRLTAPPEWDPKPSEISNAARRAIATSPQPTQEEKSSSTFIENWWGLIPVGLFGSAAWNFYRARGEEKGHDYRKTRLKLGLLNGSTDLCSSSENLEFRRVVCEGVFDENNSILVHKYLRLNSGKWINGYNLLTPLLPIPDDPRSIQTPILVNRGWVPLSWGNKESDLEPNPPPVSTASGRKVKFVGVIIGKGERPNNVWRSNNASKSKWFTVDVPAIARACGLPETTLHVVEIDSSKKRNMRKPYPFAFLRTEVKEIYMSQLEYARYSALGFVGGCTAMATGLKKFGKCNIYREI